MTELIVAINALTDAVQWVGVIVAVALAALTFATLYSGGSHD